MDWIGITGAVLIIVGFACMGIAAKLSERSECGCPLIFSVHNRRRSYEECLCCGKVWRDETRW